jgi:hypothetical protein
MSEKKTDSFRAVDQLRTDSTANQIKRYGVVVAVAALLKVAPSFLADW